MIAAANLSDSSQFGVAGRQLPVSPAPCKSLRLVTFVLHILQSTLLNKPKWRQNYERYSADVFALFAGVHLYLTFI